MFLSKIKKMRKVSVMDLLHHFMLWCKIRICWSCSRSEMVHTLLQLWNIASHALSLDSLDPVTNRQSTLSWVLSLSEISSRSWKDWTYFAIFIILTWYSLTSPAPPDPNPMLFFRDVTFSYLIEIMTSMINLVFVTGINRVVKYFGFLLY